MKMEPPFVVILAGGDGNRLVSLTRALYGCDLPKQFAVLAGEKSLLQTTIERAAGLTSLDRISVVVTAHHEAVARTQLAAYPGVELLVQPKSLDTAAGILFPLARLLARGCSARVVFLPSDHHISNAEPLAAALRSSRDRALSDRLCLVGVIPTGPEEEYGWIVPGESLGASGAYAVERFHEKPPQSIANALWSAGGLWNTFIQAGPVHVFWRLARRYLPVHTEMLERYAVAVGDLDEAAMLDAAYDAMPAASFSRDVLARSQELAVLQVDETGWSDWGSPRRVFASLAGTPSHEQLVARIRESGSLAV